MKQILAILCCACCLFGQAVPVTPNLPTSVPPSAQPTVTGTVRFVHDTGNITTNGTNLQTMYTTTASCGDQIVLDAGIEYRNNFVFNKQCNSSNWIQVVSANLSSILTTAYVSPSYADNQNTAPTAPTSANFAKLTSAK